MIRTYALGLVATLATTGLLVAGCSLSEFTVNTTAPVLYKASQNFAMESDVELAREAAAAQLKTADGFLASSPKNRLLLEVLSRGYLEYAFGFLEDDLESMADDNAHRDRRALLTSRATALYDRAFGYAMRNLATFKKDFAGSEKADSSTFDKALATLPKDAAPALLFGGMAWASSINLNRTDIARIAELPKAIAMMKRSYVLDKTFNSGMAGIALGLAAASRGKAMGGDPEAAKRYFDEAVALTGGKFLLAKVMQARFYAVVTQDQPLFGRLLAEVIAAPNDVMPAQRLPNELAKRRAARYQKMTEDLF